MLARVIARVRRASLVKDVVVATSDQPADDEVERACARAEVQVFRGKEVDVLDRYYQAARRFQAGAVVRISADCPLIDPRVADEVIAVFLKESADYASNTLNRTYPRGLDTEVMTLAALGRAWVEARENYHRVHVTPYIYQNPALFRLRSVQNDQDYSQHRWTVDTPEDLTLVRAIHARLNDKESYDWREVLTVLAQHPGLRELNRHIRQKELAEA